MGPHGVKQGETRRRLAAGEARRGGVMRVSCSGDQNDGGEHLHVAGSKPHRVVAVGGAGVAGNVAGVRARSKPRGTAKCVERCYGLLRVQ